MKYSSNRQYIQIINIIIGLLATVVGFSAILFFFDSFFTNLMNPYLMDYGVAVDQYISTWIYAAISIYAGVLILKKEIESVYLFRFLFMGLILEYISYELLFDQHLIDSIIVIILSFIFLIYFSLPIAGSIMKGNVVKNEIKSCCFLVIVNISIVGFSVSWVYIAENIFNYWWWFFIP